MEIEKVCTAVDELVTGLPAPPSYPLIQPMATSKFIRYNENLTAPISTFTGNAPKARVHRMEWAKVSG